MPATAWAGKRVFLTGHTGFKGSWMALWLERLGARVVGFALPADPDSLHRAAGLPGRFSETLGDIRDRALVRGAMERAEPDVVFHMAAQPLVRASYADPVATFTTNVMGTVHVLEAVRTCPSVRASVIITTDKVYRAGASAAGNAEDDPLGGHDPYSASKACAELVSSSYRASFFDRADDPLIATARAGNVIGGGDWAEDRLVPDLVRAILSGVPARIRAPHAIRPWQHVLEPLAGYLRLAERLLARDRSYAVAWNFGPRSDELRSVADVADAVVRHWGRGAVPWVNDTGIHPAETAILTLNPARAAERLDWQSRLSFDDSIKMTTDWYRSVAHGVDALAVTHAQIADYEALAHTSPV